MISKITQLCTLLLTLFSIMVINSAWSCEDVERMFNLPDPGDLLDSVTIGSYSIDGPIAGSFDILAGAIEIEARSICSSGCDFCGEDAMDEYLVVSHVPTRRFEGLVYRITVRIDGYHKGWKVQAYECEGSYMDSPSSAGTLILYTPVENPHPIKDYLQNRYKDDECIQPYPRDDQPPILEEDNDLGDDQKGSNGCASTVADPIRIQNGNSYQKQTDIAFDTPFAGGLQFTRYYNSRYNPEKVDALPGTLIPSINNYGYGWTNTYNIVLMYSGYWTIPRADILLADMPLADCGPELSNGYNTYFWLNTLDETGRSAYFYKISCDGEDFKGENGTSIWLPNSTKIFGGMNGLRWYRSDGMVYQFNSAGQTVRITDPSGNYQTLTYDGLDLESVTDNATGKLLTFTYNGQGLLEYISGPVTDAVPDGIWVRYGYDANENLTSVTYADGSGYQYEYDDPYDPHNMTAKKDVSGNHISSWSYDAQDRAISNTTNDDQGADVEYIDNNTIQITDAYGLVQTRTMEDVGARRKVTRLQGESGCQSCGTKVVRYAYNTSGHVEEIEYANGRIDRFDDYDVRGNRRVEIHDYNGSKEVSIGWTYHPTLDIPLTRTQASVIGTGDKVTIWDYDNDGNGTPNENPSSSVYRRIERGFTLDAAGTVTPYEYITAFEYNTNGQVTAVDGPRPGSDDRITYTYNPATADLESVTLPLSGTTEFTQYDAAGNPTRIIDPNGVEAVITYDGRNRPLTVTRNGITTGMTYTLQGKPDLVTDAVGRTLDFDYDPQAFLERITDPAGNYKSFGHTALGNPESTSAYTSTGNQTSTFRYDYGEPLNNPELEPGKPWKAITRNHDDTADLETIYTYDVMGNLTTVTDAASSTTSYRYDVYNRLYCIEQPGNTVIDYDYDANGNLINVIDPEGLVTTYLYDDMNRLVRTDSPDTGLTRYSYDDSGNRVAMDQNGQITEYAYDAENRIITTIYTDGSSGVSYDYDTGTGNYLMGRLSSITETSGVRIFSYDANGNLDYEQRTIGNVTYTTDYDFDAAGNLRSITYPTGQTVQYIADNVDPGLVGSVQLNGAQNLATGLAYQPFGPNTGMTLGNALQSVRTYDKNHNFRTISAGNVLNYTYTPDNVGRVATITDNLDPSRSQSFSYDALSHLQNATGNYGTIGFTYDRTGNRLTRTAGSTTDTYTYAPSTNQLATISGSQTTTFNHDNRGNLLSRTITAGTPPTNTVIPEYTYTSDGQRVSKTADETTTIYHYDITGLLIAETDTQGNMVKAYIWLHNQPLAMVSADSNVYFYHNDHLGTPKKMTDGNGTVVWAADYLPFGQASVIIGTVENNLRFAGQYYDQETGLHYNYHRYYDPKLGRYLRADPIGLEGGINLYAYVQNNPVNLIDPYGLLFGVPAGEGYGESSAMYYANITTDPCASTAAKAGAWVGGLFASLWTPDTSNETFLTLLTAGAGAGVHAAKDGYHLGKIGYHSIGKGVLKNNIGKKFALKFANKKRLLHINAFGRHIIVKSGKILQQLRHWRTLK